MKNEKLQRYRFEIAVQDVKEGNTSWLKDEFKRVLELNKPYQSKADYIGYSILSIDEKIDIITKEINELSEYKRGLKQSKEIVLQVGAEVFDSYGISKIEGAGISSITVTNPKKSTKLVIDEVINEEALIQQGFYKKVLDEKAVILAYEEGTYKELVSSYANISLKGLVTSAKLRVNKRQSNHTNINISKIGRD